MTPIEAMLHHSLQAASSALSALEQMDSRLDIVG